MRTRVSFGLFLIVIGIAACTGGRKPTAAQLADDSTMRTLVGTWRSVNRDGTLSQNDHYRLEFNPELREMSLIWVSEVDDAKSGRFLKGDEKAMVRFKLEGRKINGVRAWGDKWIKIYNGYVSEDLRHLQYQLQYSFIAGGCRDAAGNPCTDPEKYARVP